MQSTAKSFVRFAHYAFSAIDSDVMSIPKKGSRKIIVGENEFLWLIRSKLTYSQDCLGTEMTAVVEPDAGPH